MRTKKGTPQVVPHCHTVFLIWRRASEKFDSKRAKTTFLEPTLGGGEGDLLCFFLKLQMKRNSTAILFPFGHFGGLQEMLYIFLLPIFCLAMFLEE